MRQFRLTLKCATAAEVRALRDQLDDAIRVEVPEESFLEAGTEVEVDVELPDGAVATLTGMCGSPGPAGVAVSLDPLTPEARAAIDKAAPELDPPTRRNTGYGAEPVTARIQRIEVPAAAFRDDHPRVVKRPPPPLPPVPKPVVKVPTIAQPPALPAPPVVRSSTPTVPAPTVPSTETAEQLLALGRLDEALVAFQHRAKTSPHDQAAHVGVELVAGLRARDRGDRFEATQRFEAALAIDPDDARAAAALTEIRREVTEARLAGLTKLVDKKP